jgi:hypothetical protein
VSQNESEESYLTVAEVAETLKLPALRVGRRVRIKRSDFQRILDDSYNAGAGSPARAAGPSADDFWGGEPVGLAEPAPAGLPVDPSGAPAVDLAAAPAVGAGRRSDGGGR